MTGPAEARGPEKPPTPGAIGQPSDPSRPGAGRATSWVGPGQIGTGTDGIAGPEADRTAGRMNLTGEIRRVPRPRPDRDRETRGRRGIGAAAGRTADPLMLAIRETPGPLPGAELVSGQPGPIPLHLPQASGSSFPSGSSSAISSARLRCAECRTVRTCTASPRIANSTR